MNKKTKALIGLAGIGSVFIADQSFAVAQTFTGSLVPDGNFGGNIQVQIVVNNGLITSITTPVVPTQNISYVNMAVPTLINEALTAQSANINGVSGASAISSAFKSSLAFAIASAGSAIGVQVTPPPVVTPPVITPTSTPVVLPPTSTVSSGTAIDASKITCNTQPVVITPIPDVTSAPVPSGKPVLVGVPTPVATSISNKNITITTVQSSVQTLIQTVTKSQSQLQLIMCIASPTPAPTVTVTASPLPAVTVTAQPLPAVTVIKWLPLVSKAVITKTIKCVKNNLIKTVKSSSPKCPVGYKKV
jgi:hypothetical protein